MSSKAGLGGMVKRGGMRGMVLGREGGGGGVRGREVRGVPEGEGKLERKVDKCHYTYFANGFDELQRRVVEGEVGAW